MKKNIKILVLFLFLAHDTVQADWGSIGGQFSSFGTSIWSGLKGMAAGMTGAVPSGYRYSFRVFNGSSVPVYVEIKKVKNIMGARWSAGTGDTCSLAVGDDSGSLFTNEGLYMSINISGSGLSYSDDHYTLGVKNDASVHYYHIFCDKSSEAPTVEMLGSNFTTSTDFSCRIENNTGSTIAAQFTVAASAQGVSRTMIISDIDPGTFNYLKISPGYTLRAASNTAILLDGKPIIVPPYGIANNTGTTKSPASTPSVYNYIVNSSAAFETGIGPGNFDQPQTVSALRDISPIECQFYVQNASQTNPIGTLQPYDITWQSVWYVYSGYGWSQEAGAIIQYPCGMIPRGSCASAFIIRPSASSIAASGPARLYTIRLNVPENVSGQLLQDAQNFLRSLVAGGMNGNSYLSITGLFASQSQSGQLEEFLTKSTVESTQITGSGPFQGVIQYQPGSSIPVYPPLSSTYFGQTTLNPSNLTIYDKIKIISTELSDSVGLLSDPQSHITGYVLTSDVFYPYGMSSGPFYYLCPAPYLDISQMYSALFNYAALCGYQNFSGNTAMSTLGTILQQTITGWITDYVGHPEQIKANIATLLVLVAQNKMDQVQTLFGGSTFVLNAIPGAEALLSPQGMALLKMLLYGPVSVSQLPVYNKVGSVNFGLLLGWPTPSVYL